MIAKERLIDFLKTAPKTQNGIYKFSQWFLSKDEMDKYIHCIRVELARIRGSLRERGKQLRAFKIIVVSKVYDKDKKQATITLRFKDSLQKDFSAAVDSVFDIVSQGTDTLDEKHVRGLRTEPKNYNTANAIGRIKIHVKAK